MISTVRKKGILFLAVMFFLMLSLAACGDDEKEKEKTEIREVAQKYFDALKVGDQEGEYDCYLPIERQKRDAASGVVGFVSEMVLNVNLSELLLDMNTLFGQEVAFSKYKYKAADVDLDEDGMDAVAYVNVYEEKELYGSVCVDMTKYDGSWYVVRGTIADDDRDLDQTAEDDESSPYGNENYNDEEITGTEEEAVAQESDKTDLLDRIWLPILIAVFLAGVAVFLIIFFRLRSIRKPLETQFPFVDPSGNKIDSGDILCSCGTINPVGMRTCINCGKKLKRRR